MRTEPLAPADSKTLQVVRPEVRNILTSSPAFAELAAKEQKHLTETMVRISAYMADPDGLLSAEQEWLARPQTEALKSRKKQLSIAPGFAGKNAPPDAVRAGVSAFGGLVESVDFPQFVGGLIQGVFQAIVDSSLQQMRAYGELLANVAATVDQFTQENITDDSARDWLTKQYPDVLGVDPSCAAAGSKLIVKATNPKTALKKISGDLGLKPPVTALSDEAEERRLVQKARRTIARSRQQLLASMVMMGINRIVVTDGRIKAG